jgi:hypothetical protein
LVSYTEGRTQIEVVRERGAEANIWIEEEEEEVAGECVMREELHDVYVSANIITAIKSRWKWAGPVARMGDMRNACSIKPEGKRLLATPRRRWEDNIRIDLVGGRYLLDASE